MNIALVLSGGTGSRLGGDIPKQYIRVNGFMVITYAIRPLLMSRHIDAIVVVADEKWRGEISKDLESDNALLHFADPGKNRQLSILSGMEKALKICGDEESSSAMDSVNEYGSGCERQNGMIKEQADTVFIHDAARPLLKAGQIDDCYKALTGHDGVMPVLPMKDTVYLSSDGLHVEKLLPRSSIFAGQAPELFLLEKYYPATKSLLPDDIMKINGSTEVAIRAGLDVVMIPGDEGNFKITTMPDLERFRGMAGAGA